MTRNGKQGKKGKGGYAADQAVLQVQGGLSGGPAADAGGGLL